MLNFNFPTNMTLLPTHAMIYGTPDFRVDPMGRQVKELILKNQELVDRKIAELTLNASRISALNQDGTKQLLYDFKGQVDLVIPGMHMGRFLKTKSGFQLQPGSYDKLRFYLGNRECHLKTFENESQSLEELDFMDFVIEDGLRIDGGESPELILWFDLVPYPWFNGVYKFLKALQLPDFSWFGRRVMQG